MDCHTLPVDRVSRTSKLSRGFHLTSKWEFSSLGCQVKKMALRIRQGTLDLMIRRTLATMGPQHAYGIANRLQQVSEDALNLNQGTIYPALVRIEQHGWPGQTHLNFRATVAGSRCPSRL